MGLGYSWRWLSGSASFAAGSVGSAPVLPAAFFDIMVTACLDVQGFTLFAGTFALGVPRAAFGSAG